MMKCPRCGMSISENSTSCAYCKLTINDENKNKKYCEKCCYLNNNDAEQCENCGESFIKKKKKPGNKNNIIAMFITLFIVFLFIAAIYLSPSSNNKNNVTKDITSVNTETKLKNSINGKLNGFQNLDKMELDNQTNTYSIYINDIVKTKYECATDMNKFSENFIGYNSINKIQFNCIYSDNLYMYIVINDVANVTKKTIEENTKYYDSADTIISKNIDDFHKEYLNDYKKLCEKLNYKDVLRNPDNYLGKDAFWFGEIVQVVDKKSNYSEFRINVNCKKYNYINEYLCEDTMYVIYKGNESFIEDDMINMWGTMKGNYTYTSIFNASITVPKFEASIIELVK